MRWSPRQPRSPADPDVEISAVEPETMKTPRPAGCMIDRRGSSTLRGAGTCIRRDRSRPDRSGSTDPGHELSRREHSRVSRREVPSAPMIDGGGIEVARVYDRPAERPGRRVLVDRLWPRGVGKADSRWDEWCRDVAPSAELRRWYAHRPERFAEFRRRYLDELEDAEHAGAMAHLDALMRRGRGLLPHAPPGAAPPP